MMRIVVDTNIVFSTFLNINSRIGQIIINGSKYYQFYAPEYIRFEIINHKEKVKKLAKLNENDFIELYGIIFNNINIINHALIPDKTFQIAADLCYGIDIDDAHFVAINEHFKGKLWTGDKKLIQGLKDKEYYSIITTEELYSDFLTKENNLL